MKKLILIICFLTFAVILGGCSEVKIITWETHPEVMEDILRETKHVSEITGNENVVVPNFGVLF